MDDYTIPFYSLKEGNHEYEFEAGKKFFEHFENPDISGGSVKIKLNLHKKATFMELDFILDGFLTVTCDRCLDSFDYRFQAKESLYVRFGDKPEEQSDKVIIIPREESRFNIAQYIYEFSALSLPVRKVHPDNKNGQSGCNPEMLKKLEEHEAKENNTIDPRWETLLKVRNNN